MAPIPKRLPVEQGGHARGTPKQPIAAKLRALRDQGREGRLSRKHAPVASAHPRLAAAAAEQAGARPEQRRCRAAHWLPGPHRVGRARRHHPEDTPPPPRTTNRCRDSARPLVCSALTSPSPHPPTRPRDPREPPSDNPPPRRGARSAPLAPELESGDPQLAPRAESRPGSRTGP